jgi:flagellar hook-associated protein 1 FlgK
MTCLTALITSAALLLHSPCRITSSVIDRLGSPLAALGTTEINIPHTAFRFSGLGPSGTLNTRIQTGTSLHDYATQIVSLQSQDAGNVDNSLAIEENYRVTLEREYLDSTGVNLDEEMANLINIQTAYNASARTISIVQDMLDELMNTFR